MRSRRLLALAALSSIALATTSHAAPAPQIVDAKGDAVGGVAGTDIQSVLFKVTKRKGKSGILTITMTLDAAPDRTPGMLYRVLGDQSKCGSFQFSSAATLALTEQNQVYMTCGETDGTTGEPSTIVNVTPETIGNKLVWTVALRELPDEMLTGTMSNLSAFVTPADPVTGILNARDFVPGAALDDATGTKSFSY
jgi:hypothetical protein